MIKATRRAEGGAALRLTLLVTKGSLSSCSIVSAVTHGHGKDANEDGRAGALP